MEKIAKICRENEHYKHIWCIFAGNKQMNLGFKFGQNYLSDENAGQIIQRWSQLGAYNSARDT